MFCLHRPNEIIMVDSTGADVDILWRLAVRISYICLPITVVEFVAIQSFYFHFIIQYLIKLTE
jgi:hypothetical protein